MPTRKPSRGNVKLQLSQAFFCLPPACPLGNLPLTLTMDTDPDHQTYPTYAEVVTLVCDGDISIKDCVTRLFHFRQAGTWEQHMGVTSALRSLAHNPDSRIGLVTQRALLEQLNDDLWRIFTKYYEERQQIWREYNKIAMPIQNPTTPDHVPDQTRDDDMDLEGISDPDAV